MTARQRGLVLDAIDEQLTHEPDVRTRNRKLLRPNPIAPWELRIGDLRVYYDLTDEPESTVIILAVGKKVRERVLIDDVDYEL